MLRRVRHRLRDHSKPLGKNAVAKMLVPAVEVRVPIHFSNSLQPDKPTQAKFRSPLIAARFDQDSHLVGHFKK
jgi:hypothetical protein